MKKSHPGSEKRKKINRKRIKKSETEVSGVDNND